MEEVGSLFAESGYSRLPIYQDSIDNIVGVIHEKDFYAARYRGETMISALKAPVLYTTGNTKISELMRILQRNKAHMAVVVDEYGGTEGIATLEDIVEELVGDIWTNTTRSSRSSKSRKTAVISSPAPPTWTICSTCSPSRAPAPPPPSPAG